MLAAWQREDRWIINPRQIEPMRRRGDPALGAIAQRQELGGPIDRPITTPDREQHTDQISHHMMQEAIGADAEREQVTALAQVEIAQGAHRALGLTGQGAEAGEVMAPDQRRRRLAHRRQRERAMGPECALVPERRAGRPAQDQVAIMASQGGEARMKTAIDRPRPAHRDLIGQVRVHAQGPSTLGARGCRVEMHHLPGRMHPGIGAPGTMHPHRLISDPRQRLLQHLLHTQRMVLILPAAVLAAEVFDTERDALRRIHASIPTNSDSASRRCSSRPLATTSLRIVLAASASPISR